MAVRRNSTPDNNFTPSLVALDSTDTTKTVALEADPTTGALLVSSSGGAAGTQYTDGAAAVTHPVGTQEVFTNGSGVVTAVSSTNPLPVSASVTPVTDVSPVTQNITARDIASATATTNANSQSFRTGSPTAGSAATFNLSSWETVTVEVTGTWTGTLLIEGSIDGSIYYQKAVKQIGTSYIANNFTANFAGTVNVATLTQLAVRSTTAWTGTATVTVRQSVNNNGIYVHNGLNIQDAVIATNKLTIKSASTAPLVTDPAVVVSLSPNTNIASGTPTINGELGDFSGTFTNATQTTNVVATGLDGYANVLISINGTYGIASAIFEGSDDSGTTWYAISEADRTDSNAIDSGYTSLTNVSRAWQVSIPGFDSIRVRSTAVASGTVNVRLSASASPTTAGTSVSLGNPIPTGTNTIGNVEITDGTNTANIVPGDTGFNGVAVASGIKTFTFTTSVAGAQTILAATDIRGYSWIEVQYTSVGSGLALVAQTAMASAGTYVQNNNWTPTPNGALGTIGTSVGTIYASVARGNFFQLAVSALTSGTFAGTVTLKTIPPPYVGTIPASQSGVWIVGSSSATGSAVPANAFYVGGSGAGNLTGAIMAVSGADANGAGGAFQSAIVAYNNSNYDRNRNNTSAAVIAAGATTTQTSATQTTYNAKKLIIAINIATFVSGTLTFTINGITSSAYTYPILVSTALGGTGLTILRVFPGATAVANLAANDAIPRSFNVVVSGTFSATYGVDYILMV